MEDVCYEIEYALARLRDAIDFAEIEGDFQPARKWMNEVEKSIQQEQGIAAFQEIQNADRPQDTAEPQ